MRVWVSGSRGKLGAEVCRQLAAGDHEVIEADIKGDDHGGVDLLDEAAVARSMRTAEAIIHCAAIPSPENIAPAELVRINTLSTFNALEEAWKLGIRTAVLSSSGSIYGAAWAPEPRPFPYLPVDEESPLDYVDPYALTKDLLERMGQTYARRGMAVTALRFHWIVARAEARRAVDSMAEADGVRNVWGYVDLEDAARACVLALRPRHGPGSFEKLLIAASDTLARRPIDQLLAEYYPGIELRAPLAGTTGAFDCTRAERVLGWTATSTWRDAPYAP